LNRFSLNVKIGANPFVLDQPISAETFQEVLLFIAILASKVTFQLSEFRVAAHFCNIPTSFVGKKREQRALLQQLQQAQRQYEMPF